ncbi:hypothetical protein [Micromonospora deserti]|uniref:Phage tail tape measure protein n=1 Tax=Micromonospora deserti TaxID=2070366 RepID=A0A2W2CY31_9ACTN|nr:hypothetical protein [Micromonospora deserti]PZF98264.1 hypothetical protein C1I99_13845 [Micromonospora deserti]
MTRTTKVGLDVDERPFVRGMGRAAAAAEKLDDALDDVTDSAKDAAAATARAKDSTDDLGDSATDAGRDLDRLRADAQRLDRQIDETTAGVRDLARAIAATSDEAERARLAEKLSVEQGKLRSRVTLRKLIDVDSASDMGAELAGRVSVSFGARLGPLLARAPIAGLNPAVAAIGAPIAAGLTVLIGGAVAGAVVGAAGAGGVVGGLAIAARNPAVQASAAETGDLFGRAMQRAGVSFVPVTLDALGLVRSEIGEIDDDLERAFSAASRFVRPLTEDLLAGAKDGVDGFATAVERAGPVVEALGDIAQDAGDLAGDTFEILSDRAYEGSRALSTLWGIFEIGARSVVGTVAALTEAYGWMEKIGALAVGDREKFLQLIVEEHNAKITSGGLSQSLQDLINSLGQTGGAASDATYDVESLEDALGRLTGEAISVERSQIALEEAIDRAAEAAKRNGDGIDRNIPKQRANREALIGIAEAAKRASEDIYATTKSHDMAAEATEYARKNFLRTAEAMDVERGEAERLADQLFGIPREVDTRADFQPDNKGVSDWKKTLSGIPREIFTSARLRAIVDLEVRREQATQATGRRWGGITEHARDGLLREAGIYSPVSPARYAFAEPATGGEAFIPRFGDRDRSLDILSRAAMWYGQQVVPAGGAAARVDGPYGGGAEASTGSGSWSVAMATARAIRAALVGLTVQLDGRTVGYIQGRQADLYERGV